MIRKILIALAVLFASAPPLSAQSDSCPPLRAPRAVETKLDCAWRDQALCRLLDSYRQDFVTGELPEISRQSLEQDCASFGACDAVARLVRLTLGQITPKAGGVESAGEGPCTDCEWCQTGSGCCCEGQCDCMHIWWCGSTVTSYCNTYDSNWCPGGWQGPTWAGPESCYWRYQCCCQGGCQGG